MTDPAAQPEGERDFHERALRNGYVPNGTIVSLRLLARWLVSLDKLTMAQARRTTTLDDVIERARRALRQSDAVYERLTAVSHDRVDDAARAVAYQWEVMDRIYLDETSGNRLGELLDELANAVAGHEVPDA